MAHSKRNTSRPVFTAHERAMAKSAWGASSARLSRDSFLPFGSCCLCLEPAVDPVACAAAGDIFCRECALSNILAQKQEIRRLERLRALEEREAAGARARLDAEAQERAVRDFEMVQAGLAGGARGGPGGGRPPGAPEPPDRGAGAQPGRQGAGGARRGEKRKFALDEDEVLRNAEQERARARRAIEDEKDAKPTLPSFWVPSVTPGSSKKDALHEVRRRVKTLPVCPSAPDDRPHHYSLHTLVAVRFQEETDPKTKATRRSCPACTRELTNASKATMAKPCGHVLCRSCVNQFVRPAGAADPHAPGADPQGLRCYVCDADLTEGKRPEKDGKKDRETVLPGLVELKSDGTGFSAGGANEVKKSGVSFQA